MLARTHALLYSESMTKEQQQTNSDSIPPELAQARATIDNIDAALIHILAERFKCTQKVGHLKANLGLKPEDKGREQQQVARLRALAEEAGLDPVFAEKFLNFIVEEVIRHHIDIAEQKRS